MQAVRSRVLSPTCQAENHQHSIPCQWLGEMSGVDESTTTEAMIMFIDEKYLNTRILKFMKT